MHRLPCCRHSAVPLVAVSLVLSHRLSHGLSHVLKKASWSQAVPLAGHPPGKTWAVFLFNGSLWGWCEALSIVEWLALNRPPTLDYELFSGVLGVKEALTIGEVGEADLDDASG